MKNIAGKAHTFLVLALFILIVLGGCKKASTNNGGSTNPVEIYFADNVLNKNFIVDFASDNGTDITSQYLGYTFVLTKTTSYYDGQMTGTKGGTIYSGTWSSNSDYSKLVITLNTPSIPTEFQFINRQWRFTRKAFPVMELAPWGASPNYVLHMRRL
ncbi:MAG: hypothetical protein ACOYKE_03435 [Ferruginibacter sp.]